MHIPTQTTSLARLWPEALTFEAFVAAAAAEHRPLWESIHRLHRTPEGTLTLAPKGSGPWRLFVIAADWCGDAVNIVPPLAKWAAAVGIELRIVDRDTYPELMDRYLTNGARAIPVVIALGPDFEELGHWAPRPSELQEWVLAHKATMPKDERYKETRRWYARDRGESTIREVAALFGG